MDAELLIYSGGGGIKKEEKETTKTINGLEEKKNRLKERIRIFTEELKRLEENDN